MASDAKRAYQKDTLGRREPVVSVTRPWVAHPTLSEGHVRGAGAAGRGGAVVIGGRANQAVSQLGGMLGWLVRLSEAAGSAPTDPLGPKLRIDVCGIGRGPASTSVARQAQPERPNPARCNLQFPNSQVPSNPNHEATKRLAHCPTKPRESRQQPNKFTQFDDAHSFAPTPVLVETPP